MKLDLALALLVGALASAVAAPPAAAHSRCSNVMPDGRKLPPGQFVDQFGRMCPVVIVEEVDRAGERHRRLVVEPFERRFAVDNAPRFTTGTIGPFTTGTIGPFTTTSGPRPR